ncbi:hypothetical protein [Actinokineospora enzanensis]|uniref:hypothetical protein n=1 Tax=Actinokineospora enzanensis TaxID=155975 RepID=UPI00037C2024|nr:hypothetical protein [Actinokineospora enzanensis]
MSEPWGDPVTLAAVSGTEVHAWPTDPDAGWSPLAVWRGEDLAAVVLARLRRDGGIACDLACFHREDGRWWPAAAVGGTVIDPAGPGHGGPVSWFFHQTVTVGEEETEVHARLGIAAPGVAEVVSDDGEVFPVRPHTRLLLVTGRRPLVARDGAGQGLGPV